MSPIPIRRFDPFRILSPAERRAHLDAYRRFLEERDGAADLAARTLSRREAFFRDLERKPVRWEGDVDRYGFFAHFFAARRPGIDARTLWLVAIAKANEGESYGVDLELEAFLARGQENVDPIELYLMLEEQYHSRILVEACRTCGLDLQLQPPRWGQRGMIYLIRYLPERLRWIPVLCGEVLGSVVFQILRESCHVFSEQPEVEARLHALLTEIWTDELGHVAFLRARLGPWAVRAARALAPLVATALMKDVPQLRQLGCDRRELLGRLRAGLELPPEMAWMEVDGPDRGSRGSPARAR